MALAWLDTTEADALYDDTSAGDPEGECVWIDDWVNRGHSRGQDSDHDLFEIEQSDEYDEELADETSLIPSDPIDETLSHLFTSITWATQVIALSPDASATFSDSASSILKRTLDEIQQLTRQFTDDRSHEATDSPFPVHVDWRRINEEALQRSGSGVRRFDEDGLPIEFSFGLEIEEGLFEAEDPEDPYLR